MIPGRPGTTCRGITGLESSAGKSPAQPPLEPVAPQAASGILPPHSAFICCVSGMAGPCSGPDRTEINYRNPREDPLYGVNNILVTASWPAPPDADPPSSLTGQVYACASTPAPLVVTEPHGWIWAGTASRWRRTG
jgi:hypothetical protein